MKIGFGTWQMGGPSSEKDIAAIQHAISRGITHIDTAELYECEELIGKAVKVFPRESLFIATKVHWGNLGHDDLIKSCHGSLKRLDMAYVDLLYVHKPNESIPIKETAEALNELAKSGSIKNVGLSNVGIQTIKEYQKYLTVPIYAVQNHYSLICRESQKKGIIDYCRQHGIPFYAWRPIRLTYPEGMTSTVDKFEILKTVAKKYGKKPAQIAVRWLSQQEGVYVLFKSANPDHIDEILETENFVLSKSDWDMLDKKFPVQRDRSFTSAGYFDLV